MPQTPNPIATLGFIGLGVMGEPMCGHLARRSGKPILAYDLRAEPLRAAGVNAACGLRLERIAANADLILLSLPDGKAVAGVVAELEPASAGRPMRGRHQHVIGRIDARDRQRLTAKGILYRRRTGRSHARGGGEGRAQHHGRCDRRKPSRVSAPSWRRWAPTSPIAARRLRPGGENSEQHAGVPAHRRAGRGDRDRPAQRRLARGAAADHGDGVGR